MAIGRHSGTGNKLSALSMITSAGSFKASCGVQSAPTSHAAAETHRLHIHVKIEGR